MRKIMFLLLLTVSVMSLPTFAKITIRNDDPSATYTSAEKPNIKSGKMVWDQASSTLTLDNVTLDFYGLGEDLDLMGGSDMTIKLVGTNTITSTYVAIMCNIYNNKTLTITSDDGTGKLSCQGWSGIYMDYDESYLTIKNCTVELEGTNGGGINGDGWNGHNFQTLTIENANVTAVGVEGDRWYGSISYLESLVLKGCYISAPEGVFFKKISATVNDKDVNIGCLTTDGTTPSLEKIVIKSRAINETNFPDPNFRAYIKAAIDIDADDVLSDGEIVSTTTINVNNKEIKDMTGIGFFTELAVLNCERNDLSEKGIDLSANTKLEELYLYSSKLTAIDVTMLPNLKKLYVGWNNLSALDVSKNTKLISLNCYGNTGIRSLDVSMLPDLDYLCTYMDPIGTLDLSNNTKLTSLECSSCGLHALDVSMLPNLKQIACSLNPMKLLDLSHNPEIEEVRTYYCTGMESLNLSGCTKLKTVSVYNCNFSELVLPDECPSLYTLDVYINKLKGEGMKALVESMPTVTGGEMRVLDTTSSREGNSISSSLVAKAVGKGWTVLYNQSDPATWEEYAGDPGLAINDTNFPDEKFRAYVKSKFDKDHNDYLSDEEIANVKEIIVTSTGVKDLTGIHFFTELTKLEAWNMDLSAKPLDLTANTKLEVIDMYHAGLTAIDVTTLVNLNKLNVGANNLTSLDVSNNTKLTHLNCYYNTGLKSIDLSNLPLLDFLHIYGSPVGTLDLSHNTQLTILSCPKCELTTLDVSMLPMLKTIICGQNYLTTLDLSHNPELEEVDVASSNKFVTLDLSACTKLTKVYLDNCRLTELTLNPTCTSLTRLEIYANKLNGAAMTAFVESLPTTSGGFLRAYDPKSVNEGNVMTTTQVATAVAKGWKVLYNVATSGYDWKEYAGTAPGIAIDAVNFPDDNFRAEIAKKKYDDDQDGYLSDEEIESTTLSQVSEMGIEDLTGVEHFKALKYLHCNDNELTALDVSALPALEILYCLRNNITALDVTKNPALRDLACGTNPIKTLDVTKNPSLEILSCMENQLTTLDVTKNPKLRLLRCYGNQLTSLDVTNNADLESMDCSGNKLTTLDLSKNIKMTTLDCSSNKLTALNLSNLAVAGLDVTIHIDSNQIGEDAMQALVESLRAAGKGAFADAVEKPQVALAKSKNWIIVDYNTDAPYEGTEGITVPYVAMPSQPATVYDLSGRRVNVNVKKGLYITNGKKVKVK